MEEEEMEEEKRLLASSSSESSSSRLIFFLFHLFFFFFLSKLCARLSPLSLSFVLFYSLLSSDAIEKKKKTKKKKKKIHPRRFYYGQTLREKNSLTYSRRALFFSFNWNYVLMMMNEIPNESSKFQVKDRCVLAAVALLFSFFLREQKKKRHEKNE